MSLRETIAEQLAGATKARDTVRLNTLRMLRAAMKNREVELRAELKDAEIVRVIGSQIKQRKESIRQYEVGGRMDLAKKEEEELEILMSFMPEQISEEAVNRVVIEIIEELGAKNMKDMGMVMKNTIQKAQGGASNDRISKKVREFLA